MRSFGKFSICLSLALLGIARPAHADGDRPAAVALFDEAKRLMDSGRYSEACVKFAESNRLDPQLGALLHLADCYEKAGRLASAWAAFRDAAELADRRADARSLSAKDRAASLEPKLSRLTIVVAKQAMPALTVRRDGVVVGSALFGVPMPVDAGEHVVEAEAPGTLPFSRRVSIRSNGDLATINVPALAAAPGALEDAKGNDARSGVPSADAGELQTTRRVLGWSGLALGAVGAGVGLVFTLQRSSKLSDRDDVCRDRMGCTLSDQGKVDDLTDQARRAGTVSVVGFAAGGAFLAGGLLLLLWPSENGATHAAVPQIGRGFAGLSLARAF